MGRRGVGWAVGGLLTIALTAGAAVALAPEAPASAPTLKTTAAWRSGGGHAGPPARELGSTPDPSSGAEGRAGAGGSGAADREAQRLADTPAPAAREEEAGVEPPPEVSRAPATGRSSAPSVGASTRWSDMVHYAVLDLHQLTSPTGSVAAGAADHWAYTWPRDAAFSVAAMLATGHRADAVRTLHFLSGVQLSDGGFEARYRLDGSGPPDDRRRQTDGAGWTLWALGRLAADGGASNDLTELRPLLDRATAYSLAQTKDGTSMPPASPDYWEVHETEVTLGTAAALLAGLRASERTYAVLGDRAGAARSRSAADRFEQLVHLTFGPGGYQRYPGWGGTDAAICLLLPPFTASAPSGVLRAWEAYQRDALRPAGGLAPGSQWKQDGVSWTPETALVAYTAASLGRASVAGRWLDWLDRQRTTWGSLPEKVLPDGRPAGPAPLGWSAAAVVLTVAQLERR